MLNLLLPSSLLLTWYFRLVNATLLFVKSYLFTLLPFSYFSSLIIIKEAPQAANIFGTYSEGPVFIGVECQSGLTFQYEASLVSLKFRFIFHVCK